jgi:hypothetical protein
VQADVRQLRTRRGLRQRGQLGLRTERFAVSRCNIDEHYTRERVRENILKMSTILVRESVIKSIDEHYTRERESDNKV